MEPIAAGRLERLEADKRFSRFRPMEERAKRIPKKPRRERGLGAILQIWGGYASSGPEGLKEASISLGRIRYSRKDVWGFCESLKHVEDEGLLCYAGGFLNALVERGRAKSYTLPLDGVDDRLEGIGEFSKKGITILGGEVGGLGDYGRGAHILAERAAVFGAGTGMEGGSIFILGDAAEPIGCEMARGAIVVRGDARKDPFFEELDAAYGKEFNDDRGVGSQMIGGIITILGDADVLIGHRMEGGKIMIGGKIGEIGDVWHGKIYSKGKLIVDK